MRPGRGAAKPRRVLVVVDPVDCDLLIMKPPGFVSPVLVAE
jgi:hypothetical protein